MRVVLTSGAELSCRNFKAIDSGVLLTKDKKRKKVVGFVPHHQLRYVVPDDAEVVEPATEPPRVPSGGDETDNGRAGDESAGEKAGENAGESDLRRLGGLGSTYAERLRAAGYATLEDLAEADPVAVSEAASVAPGRGRRWVTAAGRATAPTREQSTDEGTSEERDAETEAETETGTSGVDDGDDGDVDDDGDGDTERRRDDAEPTE